MLRKILYPLLLVLVIWLFGWGLPVDFSNRYPVFLAFTGSILGTGALVMSLLRFSEGSGEKNESAYGFGIFAALTVFLFGFGVFIFYNTESRVEAEFKENGVYTLATIKDGSSVSGDKFDLTSVKVNFTNEEGKNRYADIDISASEFNGHYVDEKLPIVYSRNYPTMARIINDKDDYKRFTATGERELGIKDLTGFLQFTPGKAANDFLNTVNQQWEFKYFSPDSSYSYTNEVKNIRITAFTNEMKYVTPGGDKNLFVPELEKSGYRLIKGNPDNLNEEVIYKNDSFVVARKIEPVRSNLGRPEWVTSVVVVRSQR
jgi:hypothetical protein